MKNLKCYKTAYFPNFLKSGAKLLDALCSLVSDIQIDKEATVSKFLDHPGSEDFIWSILKLLGFKNEKIAGNAAFVIGTIADTNDGSDRLIAMVIKSEDLSNKILDDLIKLLTYKDDEIVLNSVGALGSLVDSESGRQWICNVKQFDLLLDQICSLVCHKNVWIGSNSALLLARLTILAGGLQKMLKHDKARDICSNLISCLGSDAAGRGMNAAFALGRIFDVSGGQALMSGLDSEKQSHLISVLSKMVQDRDVGTSKNALYAFSCLASQKTGSALVARSKVIEPLASLDTELRWFSAMTLRSFACQQNTCLELKKLHFVYNSCRAALKQPNLPDDIKEELIDVFEYLRPLPQGKPPHVELIGPMSVKITWEEVVLKGPFKIRYSLFHKSSNDEYQQIYSGRDASFTIGDLKPYTWQFFKLRLVSDHEEGLFSECVSIRTEEWLPGQVRNLHMLGNTASQIKIQWDEPLEINGIIRHYVIYLDGNSSPVGRTEEQYFILQNLQSPSLDSATYTVHVAAVTGRGEGLRLSLDVSTADIGDSRPSKPNVSVLGRNEAYVTWSPPPNPPQKILRYELIVNGESQYSGTELFANVLRLQPSTEYNFQVIMFSNEGKFYSLITKKCTQKDEFSAFSSRPRTSSVSKLNNRRSAKSAHRSAQTQPVEVDQGAVDTAEMAETEYEGKTLATIELKRSETPPKPFQRSKTVVPSRRKSSTLRRTAQPAVKRNIPPVQKDPSLPSTPASKSRERGTEGKRSTRPEQPAETITPTVVTSTSTSVSRITGLDSGKLGVFSKSTLSLGDAEVDEAGPHTGRERSDTVGSRTSKSSISSLQTVEKETELSTASTVPSTAPKSAAPRIRRQNSMAHIQQLVTGRFRANQRDGPQSNLKATDQKSCSVVTLGLANNDDQQPTDSRWAPLVGKSEMITASQLPAWLDQRANHKHPEQIRRANTFFTSSLGNYGAKQNIQQQIQQQQQQQHPSIGHRAVTMFIDSAHKEMADSQAQQQQQQQQYQQFPISHVSYQNFSFRPHLLQRQVKRRTHEKAIAQ